ncbi:unnamed protein product, partial [Ectocarpus sp. 6 AP-2014]
GYRSRARGAQSLLPLPHSVDSALEGQRCCFYCCPAPAASSVIEVASHHACGGFEAVCRIHWSQLGAAISSLARVVVWPLVHRSTRSWRKNSHPVDFVGTCVVLTTALEMARIWRGQGWHTFASTSPGSASVVGSYVVGMFSSLC